MAFDGGFGKFVAIGVIVGTMWFYGGLLICWYLQKTSGVDKQ